MVLMISWAVLPVGVTTCPRAGACDPTQTQFWSVPSRSAFGLDGSKTPIPSVKIIRTGCAEHPPISDSFD